MVLIAIAFIAGLLTVFAPCVLPVLPVVLGTTVVGRKPLTPYVVIGSLAGSIVAFTFLLKTVALSATIDPLPLQIISGTIIGLIGLGVLMPDRTRALGALFSIRSSAEQALGKGIRAQRYWGDALAGISLGPIFASCSPTYFLILAAILPVSLIFGTVAIISYVFGLSLMLLIVAFFSERIVKLLSLEAQTWKRIEQVVGVLFIVLGMLIAFGIMKRFEVYVLSVTPFDVTELEYRFLKYLPSSL